MESVTRRSVLAGATGLAAVGLANQLVGEETSRTPAPSGGQGCLCTIQIPSLNTPDLNSRSEAQSRDLIGALIGVVAPIIVEEIIKATRTRSEITSNARLLGPQDLAAPRDGGRAIDNEASRALFGGSFSGPGIKIGVVIG